MQRRGGKTRQKAGTALNYASSRSHAVFTIILQTAEAAREQDDDVRNPRSLVDAPSGDTQAGLTLAHSVGADCSPR